jgi:hypothetical protein
LSVPRQIRCAPSYHTPQNGMAAVRSSQPNALGRCIQVHSLGEKKSCRTPTDLSSLHLKNSHDTLAHFRSFICVGRTKSRVQIPFSTCSATISRPLRNKPYNHHESTLITHEQCLLQVFTSHYPRGRFLSFLRVTIPRRSHRQLQARHCPRHHFRYHLHYTIAPLMFEFR